MEPEKTRAANSPTLKPAAATHVSMACGQKRKKHERLNVDEEHSNLLKDATQMPLIHSHRCCPITGCIQVLKI